MKGSEAGRVLGMVDEEILAVHEEEAMEWKQVWLLPVE